VVVSWDGEDGKIRRWINVSIEDRIRWDGVFVMVSGFKLSYPDPLDFLIKFID
jgi:hypothetical protein